MDSKKIQTSKNCVTANSLGTYASKRFSASLKCLTSIGFMMICTMTAWAQDANGNMTWSGLKTAMEAGQSVTLTNDVTRDANSSIVVENTVTLDLNGHTIYGYETGSSTHYQYTHIFSVGAGGKLTITDGSSDKRGTITNVWGASAIYIYGTDESSYGEATFEAGTIASGGVSIKNYGRFTMTGGTISIGGNQGVIINVNATFTMTGGTITGNTVGVNISSASSTFTVSGNVNITGNTTNDVSLYYEGDSKSFNPIHIGGPLASTARIGVSTDKNAGIIDGKTFTEGLDGNGSRANFVSNIDDLEVVTTTSGELALGISITAHPANFNGVTKYWATFYHNSIRIIYRLPEGSQAFYMKSDNVLYLLGNGDLIPAECAVIIMSDTDKIGLYRLNSNELENSPDQPDDNKLRGTNSPKNVSDVYVLSEVEGVFGFYKFTGEIPAHKAYYE